MNSTTPPTWELTLKLHCHSILVRCRTSDSLSRSREEICCLFIYLSRSQGLDSVIVTPVSLSYRPLNEPSILPHPELSFKIYVQFSLTKSPQGEPLYPSVHVVVCYVLYVLLLRASFICDNSNRFPIFMTQNETYTT